MSIPAQFRDFKGTAKRIEDLDISRLAYMIGVGEDELHALCEVESLGSGFDAQGRPKILFEPHVFYRNLSGTKRAQAVKQGLAYADWKPGNYGVTSEQYPKLGRAIAIDETAALKAASWGGMQLLGENHKDGGYKTVQEMVLAFMEDEDNHLEAAVRFIEKSGIGGMLRELAQLTRPTTPADAIPIVKRYNGPGYAKNNYHVKFARAHNKWRKIKDTPFTPSPNDEVIWKGASTKTLVTKEIVENVQRLLRDKGFPEVGDVDGKLGKRTVSAIESFQSYVNMPKTGKIDNVLLAELVKYPGRPQAPTRANATVQDLKEQPTVSAADKLQKGGKAVIGIGTLGAIFEGFDFDRWKAAAENVRDLSQAILAISPWVLGIVGGGAALWFGQKIIREQVQAYREGRSL